MQKHTGRHEEQDWDNLAPEEVLALVVYELYNPVSLLGSQLNYITNDEDPLTEEEYEHIFQQMQEAVDQLSKTVVNLKRYTSTNQLNTPDVE